MDGTDIYLSPVNIGSGNGWVLLGNKPMLTKSMSLGNSELI